MAKKQPTPRKERTREHVIADLGVNHVERMALEEGHSAERPHADYGYDLVLFTYDEQGHAEEGSVYFQIKASDTLRSSGAGFVFDVDVRDYNRWGAEPMPVILVLFDATRRHAYWLYAQRYFVQDTSRVPRQGAKTVRVRVPKRQALTRASIRRMRAFKQEVLAQIKGVIDHG